MLNTYAHFQLGKSPSLNRISIISQPKTSTTEDAGGSLAAPTVSQRVRKLSGNLFSKKKESGQLEGSGAQIVFQFGGSDAEEEDEERNKKLDSEDSQGEIEQHWPLNLNL